MSVSRREFIKIASSTTAAVSIGGLTPVMAGEKKMPKRELGSTGEKVSILTLGGHHIGVPGLSDQEAIRLMRTAIDAGVNFFDNAWDYHNGRSEKRMGKALKNGYRDRVMIMSKHLGRTPGRAKKQLETSLRRFQVETIDLWQFHSVSSMNDVNKIYNSGALNVAEKARKQGKIRYIGFTGHYRPKVHRKMIEKGFDWDTVQMPINPLDYHYESFTREILPLARKKKIGVIAMKTLGSGTFPDKGIASAQECHRYALSQPVSTVCTGMDSMKILKQNLRTFTNFTPMNEKTEQKLLARAKQPAQGGKNEWYK